MIKRYEVNAYCERCGTSLSEENGVDIDEDNYGEYVKYADHRAEKEELLDVLSKLVGVIRIGRDTTQSNYINELLQRYDKLEKEDMEVCTCAVPKFPVGFISRKPGTSKCVTCGKRLR